VLLLIKHLLHFLIGFLQIIDDTRDI